MNLNTWDGPLHRASCSTLIRVSILSGNVAPKLSQFIKAKGLILSLVAASIIPRETVRAPLAVSLIAHADCVGGI